MQIKRGIAVSPGVAIYPAVVLDAEDQPIPRRTVPPSRIDREHHRLAQALSASTDEVTRLREQTAHTLSEELANIFSFHLGMLNDPHLVRQFEAVIDAEHVTAEYAVYEVMHRFAQSFLRHENRYLRERVSDVWDLERRILKHLIGHARTELSSIEQPSVVVAHDLTPSQTAALDKNKIKGIATDAGGRTSHTAILAHALGIPAIVGLENITRQVASGDLLIIDGNRGAVVADPDAAKLMEYRAEMRRMAEFATTLGELKDLPAETTDGAEVNLLANIEFPSEINLAVQNGANGIGLYRTEFLYLAAETEPSEEEQYENYVEAINALEGRPMTIRTLDLGADKVHHDARLQTGETVERNPFLGCRSIRLCLQNLPLFKRQLRAILRASHAGPVRIMFPLISNVMELRQAKMVLNDVIEDLEEQEIPFQRDIPVGIMVEVPSTAIQAKTFAREADFMSIGTNDLIQYTLAVDRGNERIASLYTAGHPAVISLIRSVLRAAEQAKIEVSLCGEMAGEPEFAMLLLGLCLRVFSITPPAIPEIKKIIRSVSVSQCQRVARRAMSFDSDREVVNYLRDELNKIMPEVYGGRSVAYD